MADEEKVIEYDIKYEVSTTDLKIIRTPSEVIPVTESYNIDLIKAELIKIDNAIAQWQDKRKPLQDILDKYTELKPAEPEPEQ